MRLRRAAVVLGIGAISISAVLSAQPPPALPRTLNGPDLDPVLVTAGRYLEQYERDVTAVIAQEDYLQRVPVEAKFRRLRSDLLIVAEAHVGWVEFRDTFEVDERPVRDRDNRAADLFLKPNPSALQQAKRIAGESARFNLSPQRYAFNRTLNVPLTALRFLRRPNQSRSTFQIDRRDATGVVVGFKETASPRLIASEDSAAATGSFTLDPESGRVLRTEFTLPSRRVSGTFTVEYAEQPALKLWLPAAMVERYVFPGGVVMDGRATYSNFRMFRVETKTIIVK